MAYFNELPNLQYTARFPEQSSNEDVVLVKNIFRRGKLRDDIAKYLTSLEYYVIKTDERPDQIAEKVYNDAELDWVVLITNNIIDYNSEWPLTNDTFYNYLLDKYGSDDVINDTLRYTTLEVRDEYERLVVPKGLIVDPDFGEKFTTTEKTTNPLDYELKSFPVPSQLYPLTITTNLGERVEIWERDNQDDDAYSGEIYEISDIRVNEYYLGYRHYFSFLKVHGREDISDIYIKNSLSGWPNTWGGVLPIYDREGDFMNVTLPSTILNDTDVNITDDKKLYYITEYEDKENNTKTPIFRFTSID